MADCDLLFRVTPATNIANNTTDFFTAVTLGPTGVGQRICTVTLSMDTAVIVYARLNGVNCALNSGGALVANALYTFSFVLYSGDTLTLRCSAAAAVNVCTGVVSRE